MSGRNLAAALDTELDANILREVYFVELQFASGTTRLNTSLSIINTLGNNWFGTGSLGSIAEHEESIDLSPKNITLGLSGMDATILNAALNENYFERPVIIYLGALNTNHQLVATPDVWYEGTMAQMRVTVGSREGDVIELDVENEFIRIDRASNVRYTADQLQREYPGDLGLEYVALMEDIRPIWRGKQSQIGGGTSKGYPGNLSDIFNGAL